MTYDEYTVYLQTLLKYQEYELYKMCVDKNTNKFKSIKSRYSTRDLFKRNTMKLIKFDNCIKMLKAYIKKIILMIIKKLSPEEYIERIQPLINDQVKANNSRSALVTIFLYTKGRIFNNNSKVGEFQSTTDKR